MTEHPGELLSAYLDDDLDAVARTAVAEHLAACRSCQSVVDDLRSLRTQAQAWAATTALPPTGELWSGIAARLDPGLAPVAAARVLPWYRRRWELGVAELALAATLVAAVTAGVMWRGSPAAPPATPQVEPVLAQLEPIDAPAEVVTVASFADAQFDAAVADLEQVLREQRDSLDPRTVIVLERNLQVIDEAIREARTALATDPANALLNAHLAEARQRKLNLLRRAALITEGV